MKSKISYKTEIKNENEKSITTSGLFSLNINEEIQISREKSGVNRNAEVNRKQASVTMKKSAPPKRHGEPLRCRW